MRKDLEALVEAVREQHPEVVISKRASGHWTFEKNGDRVVTSGTPSDSRTYLNAVSQLRRAGMLDHDPRSARKPFVKKVFSTKAERDEASQTLHERAKAILAPCGVWKEAGKGRYGWRGTTGEVARVFYFWAQENFPEESPPSENAAAQITRQLYKGRTIAEDSINLWNLFFDDLEQGGVVSSRYAMFVREMNEKRTQKKSEPEALVSLPEEEEEEEEKEGITDQQLRRGLELMSYMRFEQNERDRVISLIHDTVTRLKPRRRSG